MTIDGELLMSTAELTYNLPAAPQVDNIEDAEPNSTGLELKTKGKKQASDKV